MAMLRRGEAPLEFRDLYGSRSGKGSARMLDMPGPAIVIAGSGMCSGGRILAYLEKFLPDSRTDVLFVGYQGRGTLGRKLLEGAREVEIDGARAGAGASAGAPRLLRARRQRRAPRLVARRPRKEPRHLGNPRRAE